ncbi:MAG TPA: ATPase, T2SS/T4P/T4SS family, partial [bacterium]|nr:ATPase, T2SS/T4P/T4SS family [bacterium]
MDGNGVKKRLGDILVEQGVITRQQLERALREQSTTGKRIGDFLVDMGFVRPEAILRALARQHGMKYVNLKETRLNPDAKNLLPESVVRDNKILPLEKRGDTIRVAVADPDRIAILQEIAKQEGVQIEAYLSLDRDIDERVAALFPVFVQVETSDDFLDGVEGIDSLTQIAETEDTLSVEELKAEAEDAPAILLVNKIVSHGITSAASDIHIEPKEKELQLRYRMDGVLKATKPIPKKLQNHILSRVKIISGMDISERRLPQDGRFRMQVGERVVDFRVSSLPTIHGEKIVLRLLDKSRLPPGLSGIGLESREEKILLKVCTRPYGMILVTGPTGSGKSTTLYSFLKELATPDRNVITIEDPVELENPLVNQVHVKEDIGLTFAQVLRTILRQDPDVVMVGEIRDLETVEIAIRTALTGHLVLSTLHTNDAPSTVTRLLDMGVAPFMISAALSVAIAQRLVRKVCDVCKVEYQPDEKVLDGLGLEGEERKGPFFRGKGCDQCNELGYRGRIGIFEVIEM